jgi:hypothetical protein
MDIYVDTAASYRSFHTAGGQSHSFHDFFIIFIHPNLWSVWGWPAICSSDMQA